MNRKEDSKMSKIDEIRSAMVAAMKAGDKERKAALSFLLSSLKNKAIEMFLITGWGHWTFRHVWP